MIRDITLTMTETRGDAGALAAAIAFASTYQAHLAVVQPVSLPLPTPGPWEANPDALLEEMCMQARAEAEDRTADLRARLATTDISWEICIDEAWPLKAPGQPQTRYADVDIVAAPVHGAADAGVARKFFSSMLFESGRPVLVIPASHPAELPIRHAVVAWKPSREAVRAIHDALPLLTHASSIDLVTVEPGDGADNGFAPDVDIATHLSRHGLQVKVIRRPRSQTVATTLLRHAAETEAQLLIAGGYGHSRLREWALGGTTRELLRAMHLPVLFSH